MTKTLLVGLDAACWEYLNPLLEAGRLPTLKGLMEAGTWGTLHSTMPAWTPTAWASIVTGKNPGKHGIFDMLWRPPGSYQFFPTSARLRRGSPFWRRLNEAGLRVGLVNIPFTHPPEPLDGFLVCGFGTPNSAAEVTYPPNLQAQIAERFGEYAPTVPAAFLRTAEPDDILTVEREHQTRQVQIALDFARSQGVDVLVINLMLTDHANHKMPDMERVQQAYCHADEDLQRLIDGFQPDNVMLISDHGSRRVKGDFLLYAWLRDRGYLVQMERTPAEQSDALNWILAQWLQAHHGWSGLFEKAYRYVVKTALPFMPSVITRRFWNNLETIIPFARPHIRFSEKLNYKATSIFPWSSYAGLLQLNIAGREPQGVLRSEEQAEFLARLIAGMKEIVDPDTGHPLFPAIYTARELYNGPALAYAPDLILDTYNSPWNILETHRRGAIVEQTYGRYFAQNRKDFGWHSRDGIFVFAGPSFTTGPATVAGHVMDIPATLLHLHGVPIPDDYDGQVLTETLQADFVAHHPIRFQAGDGEEDLPVENLYSPEEEAELVAHLQALGYLE
ncbi:MAG: hypothetical protein D6796_09440 [Caldilineae bacterium]|nr:MAG: hypothetical protein D6796_09440 [Caldilineae bacterium]